MKYEYMICWIKTLLHFFLNDLIKKKEKIKTWGSEIQM